MAAYDLTFEQLHLYDAGDPGITLTVALSSGGNDVTTEVKVDTGSSKCIFERLMGEDLGLDVESGYPIRISTATGSFPAFGHEVTLTVADYVYDAMVYFAKDYEINRNVLGRHGFLNRVRMGLIDYEGELYLSRYGDHL